MERIVTVNQMRSAEKRTMEERGIGSRILMERAGVWAAEQIADRYDKSRSAVICCGMGNNGGDGMVVARILYEKGWQCSVLFVGDPAKRSEENKHQLTVLEHLASEAKDGRLVLSSFTERDDQEKIKRDKHTVYVDAILGIGQSRPLSGEFAEACRWMNDAKGPKVILDVPTGIDSDNGCKMTDPSGAGDCVMGDLTLCFGALKSGLLLADGKYAAGKVKVNGCGIFYGEEMTGFLPDKKDLARLLKRDPRGHKGIFGKIAFLAGSPDAPGAAMLAVRSAFLSGAGYIRLLSDKSIRDPVLGFLPECVFASLDKKPREKIASAIGFADVIAAGCGLGTTEVAKERLGILFTLLAESDKKPVLILDADAINLIASDEKLKIGALNTGCSLILTPHMMEFARLTGLTMDQIRRTRVDAALKAAKDLDAVVILKDAETLIASPEGKFAISSAGNDGMAVAGCGDTLLGIVSSVAGRVKDPFFGAVCGAYLHGLAGDRAAKRLGRNSMMPSDLADELPAIMKKTERKVR
ncbi:MAG: NAD(P)H-hydrate dehydratase [Lachnospiraceae bacterium]|nr:NAD(P)H-hydrate dehydratase [Lachnospiraceae bacterium]